MEQPIVKSPAWTMNNSNWRTNTPCLRKGESWVAFLCFTRCRAGIYSSRFAFFHFGMSLHIYQLLRRVTAFHLFKISYGFEIEWRYKVKHESGAVCGKIPYASMSCGSMVWQLYPCQWNTPTGQRLTPLFAALKPNWQRMLSCILSLMDAFPCGNKLVSVCEGGWVTKRVSFNCQTTTKR